MSVKKNNSNMKRIYNINKFTSKMDLPKIITKSDNPLYYLMIDKEKLLILTEPQKPPKTKRLEVINERKTISRLLDLGYKTRVNSRGYTVKKEEKYFKNKRKATSDWSPKSWLNKRVTKPDGSKYTEEDVKALLSHVPEYLEIESKTKLDGSWLVMPNGSIWKGDPRVWVMMLSKAFNKNYKPEIWYTGLAEWPTTFNYGYGNINTNKVTRAPYYDGLMWFSNSKNYGDAFAYKYNMNGVGNRTNYKDLANITGHNFLAAIPKVGNYRVLTPPPEGKADYWEHMPYELKNGKINRIPEPQLNYIPNYWFGVDVSKSRYNTNKSTYTHLLLPDLKTDDVVNWSKDLGDLGIFLNSVIDGPGINMSKPYKLDKEGNKYYDNTYEIVNEFISQPGFTKKVKFIEGNNGDFDIIKPYKYSYINNKNKNILYSKYGSNIVQQI